MRHCNWFVLSIIKVNMNQLQAILQIRSAYPMEKSIIMKFVQVTEKLQKPYIVNIMLNHLSMMAVSDDFGRSFLTEMQILHWILMVIFIGGYVQIL